MGLYWLYQYFVREKCVRPGGGAKERRIPVQPDTTSVDMTSHIGHAMPDQGTAVFGGDTRNAFWRLHKDPCLSCSLEKAWKMGGHRRSGERFTQGDLGAEATRGASMGDPAKRSVPLQ